MGADVVEVDRAGARLGVEALRVDDQALSAVVESRMGVTPGVLAPGSVWTSQLADIVKVDIEAAEAAGTVGDEGDLLRKSLAVGAHPDSAEEQRRKASKQQAKTSHRFHRFHRFW